MQQNSVFDLAKVTVYNPQSARVWAFNKKSDVVEGITLSVGNMVSGYPFTLAGQQFLTSEAAYICGVFSQPETAYIQEEVRNFSKGGLRLKMHFRNQKPMRVLARADFNGDWCFHWMLFVVWSKVQGNADFRHLLSSIPDDVIIVENGKGKKHGNLWGCNFDGENWIGSNVMGKILMLCRDALHTGTAPAIDYDLLNSKHIWWFGQLLRFSPAATELVAA